MPGDRNVEEWKSWRELEKTLNVRSFSSTRRDRAFALRRISNRRSGSTYSLEKSSGPFSNLPSKPSLRLKAAKPCYPAPMKQRIFPALLALLLPLAGCYARPQTASSPDTSKVDNPPPRTHQRSAGAAAGFDFYLLNLSWSPEFCLSHPTATECAAHASFVLHGLWPQNANGSYPENCSNAPGPADPAQYKDIYPDQGLLKHEWTTHGTCSGLSADDFFAAARTAFHSVAIPPALSGLTSQISLSPDQILGDFTASNPNIPRSSLALSCGNNYLTAVEVCLDKNLHPMACPSVRSCRANVVRIPPP
jgi:ribonuclease T2